MILFHMSYELYQHLPTYVTWLEARETSPRPIGTSSQDTVMDFPVHSLREKITLQVEPPSLRE